MTNSEQNIYERIYARFFDDLGVGDLSPAVKQELAQKIHEHIEKAVVTHITSSLPDMTDEQVKALSDEDLEKLLVDNNLDPTEIALQETASLREDLKEVVTYMKGYLEGQQNNTDQ